MRQIVFEPELSHKQQAQGGIEQLISIMAKG